MNDRLPDLFAVTTRGLEDITAAEIAALPDAKIIRRAYRRVHFQIANLQDALRLTTADDVFLQIATGADIPHTREALTLIGAITARIPLNTALSTIRTIRPLLTAPIRCSVTANFVGKRNYSAPEIKIAVADQLPIAWYYVEDDDQAEVNLRVFLEHQQLVIGMRLGVRPLHRRAYKGSHRPGSLKPPIAAALLRLAHGDRIIDPLCGSGTIAIEAALRGKTVIAGDHDLDAVIAARHNALEAVVNLPVIRADARRLPLESASQHSVISNLPWGRQIVLNEALSAFYRAVISEMQRVATDRIVVLTAFPELLPVDDQIEQREISLFGQTPSIVVFHNR